MFDILRREKRIPILFLWIVYDTTDIVTSMKGNSTSKRCINSSSDPEIVKHEKQEILL